jgi:hypothetical protein
MHKCNSLNISIPAFTPESNITRLGGQSPPAAFTYVRAFRPVATSIRKGRATLCALLTFSLLSGCNSKRTATAPPPNELPTLHAKTYISSADRSVIDPIVPNTPVPSAPPSSDVPEKGNAPSSAERTPTDTWAVLSPGLRVHRGLDSIEFEGEVPIDVHDSSRTRVYLEWLACKPDTREHEVLVVTSVKPSLIHAAALALGWTPGAPGGWDWKGETIRAIPPTGDTVSVYIRHGETESPGVLIQEWVKDANTGVTLAETRPNVGFVFSGSRIVMMGNQSVYHADREGGVVGLACFGNETFSYADMINPDSGVDEPVWIANSTTVPVQGTKVYITIRRSKK